MALTDNLLAFYKLSDLSDSSGNNHTLTNNGNVTFASGKLGNAAVFDGSNYLSPTPFWQNGTSLTVSLWVKTTAENYSYLIGGNGPSDGFYVVMNGSGYASAYAGAEYSEFEGPSILVNDGSWHHIVLKANNGSATIYVDGVAGTSNSIPETILESGYMSIGVNGEANFAFLNGEMDAVGIWNRALSDAEVAELYNNGTGLEIDNSGGGNPTLVKMQAPVKFFGKVKFGV
jgi:hypothetical protein